MTGQGGSGTMSVNTDSESRDYPREYPTSPTQARDARKHGRSKRSPEAGPRQLQVRLARFRAAPARLQEGPERRGRGRDQPHQGRARVDDQDAAQGLSPLRVAAAAHLGRRHDRHRLPGHLLLRHRHRQVGAELGRRARLHPAHLRPAGDPGGGEEVPRRRRRAVRLRGRVPQHPLRARGAGRGLHGHRSGPEGARGPLPRVLRHDHPGQRQQARGAQHRGLERRELHLRAEGRPRGAAAAGLLPDQHREHGPVRADADHRRRGQQRALRRGLHRADLQHRQPALGGGRDHRQEGRAGPLHDHPELEPQRLQPGHQAGGRLRGLGDGVGGRQPRLAPDHEVPVHLPDGRACARRGALDRLRRRRAAPGRGRQGHPRRAEHHQPDHLEVDLQGHRPHLAIAAWSRSIPAARSRSPRCAATH